MFGVSYKTNRNEVKIHSGSCRFTINQSQSGTTKWQNYNGLWDAVRGANKLAGRNQWRYAQCCLRRESYVYECRNCSNLTRGKRFVSKKAIGIPAIFTFGFSILLGIGLQMIGTNYDPMINQLQPVPVWLFFLGIIILPIVYISHPKRCSNCKTKNFQ